MMLAATYIVERLIQCSEKVWIETHTIYDMRKTVTVVKSLHLKHCVVEGLSYFLDNIQSINVTVNMN